MRTMHQQLHHFSESELTVILEAARVAFADADLADDITDQMDLDDGETHRISEKLGSFMSTPLSRQEPNHE